MKSDQQLIVRNLNIAFQGQRERRVVEDLSFALKKGETLGIAGESGSGKSLTALAIMGLLPGAASVSGGEILFESGGKEVDICRAGAEAVRRLRGREMAMIFQEPATALNPVMRCGNQVAEAMLLHGVATPSDVKQQVMDWFERVRLPTPERIFKAYPHQLSGGQRQRVMIAMALCCNPALLIADEPTSALDATVQRAFLDLMKELKEAWQGTVIFISHDLGVVAEVADRVLVLHNGRLAEVGDTADILGNPRHTYTRQLISSYREKWQPKKSSFQFRGQTSPPGSVGAAEQDGQPLLCVEKLSTWFPLRRRLPWQKKTYLKAVDEVSFELRRGEILGIAGESGSGKTTLGRSLLHLQLPSAGEVYIEGVRMPSDPASRQWKTLRRRLQIIFQDPYAALNPRLPVGLAVAEPMEVHQRFAGQQECREQAALLLEATGLERDAFWRFPAEFSGGQRQRICIARALATHPDCIICDECVSALDASTQQQILELLLALRRDRGLSFIFISHDLATVQQISDRIAIMKEGRIIEAGDAEELWQQPQMSYTKELLRAQIAPLP
jgi:peptide/nickel transport system ATP-binding protein